MNKKSMIIIHDSFLLCLLFWQGWRRLLLWMGDGWRSHGLRSIGRIIARTGLGRRFFGRIKVVSRRRVIGHVGMIGHLGHVIVFGRQQSTSGLVFLGRCGRMHQVSRAHHLPHLSFLSLSSFVCPDPFSFIVLPPLQGHLGGIKDTVLLGVILLGLTLDLSRLTPREVIKMPKGIDRQDKVPDR